MKIKSTSKIKIQLPCTDCGVMTRVSGENIIAIVCSKCVQDSLNIKPSEKRESKMDNFSTKQGRNEKNRNDFSSRGTKRKSTSS